MQGGHTLNYAIIQLIATPQAHKKWITVKPENHWKKGKSLCYIIEKIQTSALTASLP